jgi:hypothetical protein
VAKMATKTMILEPTPNKMNWLSINENKESLILVSLLAPSRKTYQKSPVGYVQPRRIEDKIELPT